MLTKKNNILLIILVVAIGLIVYFESQTPEKQINWFPSYAKTDKIPLGTFAAYELITDAFSENEIKDINRPPYELLTLIDSISGTYVFINGSIQFDDNELKKLMSWVEKGNNLFVSAQSISSNLLDTLGIETNTLLSLKDLDTKPIVNLTNTHLKAQQAYLYDRNTSSVFFKKIDTLQTTALGIVELHKDTLEIKKPEINYIQQDFGEGNILIHTFPEAFSNYFILKNENYTYTQNVLAYIDKDKPILWDNYYKSGKKFYTSPLYFLLQNRFLKWAYYMLLIGILLFVIFEGKRKQRSIPIIEPLKNQTLAFTRTISGMYFENSKHKEIATKQNILFLEYVRSTLRISTDDINEKTLTDIAARSNNTIEDTKRLFSFFESISKKTTIEKVELTRLYELISEFKNKAS